MKYLLEYYVIGSLCSFAGNFHILLKYGIKKEYFTKKRIIILLSIIVVIIGSIVLYNKCFSLKAAAKSKAVEILEDYVMIPSTAEYNFENYNVRKDNNEIFMSGYIDALNSFGIEIRRTFRVIMFKDDLEAKRVIFNGQVVYNADKNMQSDSNIEQKNKDGAEGGS